MGFVLSKIRDLSIAFLDLSEVASAEYQKKYLFTRFIFLIC